MKPSTATAGFARYFRSDDEEGVLALLLAAFPKWPGPTIASSPLEHLRWKLASHPEALRHHIVYEADSVIAGARVAIVQPVVVGGGVVLARQGVDFAVHPAFQGRGIGRLMQEFGDSDLKATFDVSIGSTVDPAMANLDASRGFRPVGNELKLFTRRLRRADDSEPRAAGDWEIQEVSAFPDDIERFCLAGLEPFEFAVMKTKAYANWRYCDERAGAFSVRVARRGGRMLGFAVLRSGNARGMIVDLLGLPDRLDVARALVDDARHFFASRGVSRIDCCCPASHPYRALLMEHGFRERTRTIPFIYRPLRMSEAELAFLGDPAAAVHIMLGDFDFV